MGRVEELDDDTIWILGDTEAEVEGLWRGARGIIGKGHDVDE
jgi:hypothetical protein